MFRRDTSGPMDVDSMDPMGRLAEFAEPPRKRPHADLSAPQASGSSSFRFGPNTPFLFHATTPLPPARKWEPYDPQRWAGTDFGLGAAAANIGDVDMAEGAGAEGAPASPRPSAPASSAGEGAGGGEAPESPVRPKPGKGRKKKQASVEDDDEDDGERHIAQGAVTRVRRRRKEWARRGRDERDDPPAATTYNLHLGGQGGTTHSDIPGILLGYVQFIFNFSLVLGFLYLAFQLVQAVRRDVAERIDEYSVEILQEIAQCTQAYMTNRCEPGQRVPAMEAACGAWETCMNRDPKVVGRARVGAETFADIINSFVDSISIKTMLFTVLILGFLVVLTNSALFNLRAKQELIHQRELHQAKLGQVQYPYPYLPPGIAPPGPSGVPGVPGVPGQLGQHTHQPMGIAAPPEEPKPKKWLKW